MQKYCNNKHQLLSGVLMTHEMSMMTLMKRLIDIIKVRLNWRLLNYYDTTTDRHFRTLVFYGKLNNTAQKKGIVFNSFMLFYVSLSLKQWEGEKRGLRWKVLFGGRLLRPIEFYTFIVIVIIQLKYSYFSLCCLMLLLQQQQQQQ